MVKRWPKIAITTVIFLGLAPIAVTLCTFICSGGTHSHGSTSSHAAHQQHVSEAADAPPVAQAAESNLPEAYTCRMADDAALIATASRRASDEKPVPLIAELGSSAESYPAPITAYPQPTQREPSTDLFQGPLVLLL